MHHTSGMAFKPFGCKPTPPPPSSHRSCEMLIFSPLLPTRASLSTSPLLQSIVCPSSFPTSYLFVLLSCPLPCIVFLFLFSSSTRCLFAFLPQKLFVFPPSLPFELLVTLLSLLRCLFSFSPLPLQTKVLVYLLPLSSPPLPLGKVLGVKFLGLRFNHTCI